MASPAKPLDELLEDELLLDELLLDDELLLEDELEELLLDDELLLDELLLDELLVVGSSPPHAANIALRIPVINILRIIIAAPILACSRVS